MLRCGSEFGGSDTDGLCTGDKIGFVIGEKAEQRCQHGRIFESGPQFARIQPGQSEQTLRPILILQHPAERLQGDDFAIRPEIGICFHCRFRLMGRQQV